MKAAGEEHLAYRENTIDITTGFSSETMEASKKYHSIFQGLEEKNCQSKIIDPVKYSSGIKAEIKILSGEGKLRDFDMKSIIQKWLWKLAQMKTC